MATLFRELGNRRSCRPIYPIVHRLLLPTSVIVTRRVGRSACQTGTSNLEKRANDDSKIGNCSPVSTSKGLHRRAPLTALRSVLSPGNMRSPCPQLPTANTLKSLYTSIKAQRQLGKLGPDRISLLISLLGTLSLPHPKSSTVFSNPLAEKMATQPPRDHWVFILMAVRDLERLNKSLDHSSRYWAMQAELANAHDSSKTDSYTRSQALDRARYHYLGFHPMTSHPDIRLPYLQSLAKIPEYRAEVIDRFCDILREQKFIQPRLLALLWEFIVKHGVDTPAILKAKLLSVLRRRLVTHEQHLKHSSSYPQLEERKDLDLKGSSRKPSPSSIANYASILTTAVFHRNCLNPQERVHRFWAIKLGLAAFASHSSLDRQWSCLILMALFNASTTLGGNHLNVESYTHLNEPGDFSSAWRLIFSLATLEKVFRPEVTDPARSAPDVGSLKEIIGRLWNIWTTIEEQRYHPPFFRSVVLGSFLRFSGCLRDASLRDACFRHYSSHYRLWTSGYLNQYVPLEMKQLIVEHMVASVLCGQRNWNALFSNVDHLLPLLRSEIVMLLVSRLKGHDLHVAHQVFMYCNAVEGIEIASSDVLSLGAALASQGLFHLVVPYLQDARLSHPHAQELTIAILRDMRRYRTKCVGPDVGAVMADVVQRAFSSSSPPPPAFQRLIHYTLLVLARSGHPSKAVTIFQHICQSSPKYFGTRHTALFLRHLLQSRQFRLATRVYFASQPSHADPRLRRILVLGLAEGGASSIARRIGRTSVQHGSSRSRMEKSVHALDYQLRSPLPVLSLKAVAILTRAPLDGNCVRFAVQILVRARRLSAARKLFERTLDELDSQTRTTIGNIILHGVLLGSSLRSRQKMRKMLAMLDILVKTQGFLPDRVTANIMLKGLLRWGSAIESPMLRTLFDRLVKTGYSPVLGDHTPFGTRSTRPTEGGVLHDISSEKHLRPLYKMFIRAFYLRGDIRAAKTVVGYLKALESRE